MMNWSGWIAWAWLAWMATPFLTASTEEAVNATKPEVNRLREHVVTLASPGFEGRTGQGGVKAAAYLVDEFRRLELLPGFGDSFHQAVPVSETDSRTIGTNVAGLLEGTDPLLKEEYIILSAHFDHLGVREGKLYPGADDDASGVAAMLEAARCLSTSPTKPRRSILFVGFDLEEPGLIGSQYFVRKPPIALESLKLFMTSDMIGRSLGGVPNKDVFVLGSEYSPGLRRLVQTAAQGKDVRVNLLGSDLLVIDRSYYGPFRGKSIPHLFFSTGENPTYHTPEDRPETLEYAKLEAIARVLCDLTLDASIADELPRWEPSDEPSLEEAEAMLHIFQEVLAHQQELKIPKYQIALLGNATRNLTAIVEKGVYTPTQRQTVLRLAQLVMFTLP
jgi:Peptidase family M28